MRIFLAVLFFIIPAKFFAQNVNDVNPVLEKTPATILKINGGGYYHSGDLTNEFTDKFINGGFIDSTLKTGILNDLKENNRAGAELNYGLSWYGMHTQFFGRPHWGWTAGISNHEYFNLSYSKNLFELAFFGNSGFAGDTVQLAPFAASRWRFQKITLGAFNKENFSSVSIGFIKAEDFYELNGENALFYTDAYGMQMDLSLNQNSYRSDTNNRGFTSFNGWGLCTDIVFNLNSGKGTNVRFSEPFRISIENFGFVAWNSKTIHQSVDTSFHYEGFEVNNLLEGNNSPFTGVMIEDTIDIKSHQETLIRLLPFTFSVAKVTDPYSENKWQSFYGFRLRAKSEYKPMVYAGIQFQPTKAFSASLYAAFGGYGGFRGGCILNATLADRIQIQAGTGNITGWFSGSAYGKDAWFSLFLAI
jgi:hypothetical protein